MQKVERLSRYFLPTIREIPSDAQVMSHRYMLRTGMIYQTAAGIYSWLPLGLRVLQKISEIVREEQNKAGAQEIILPTIQPAELWHETGRYEAYGQEMLRIKDRHERDMLYGPTAEEVVTDLVRNRVTSYRELPLMLYQIHWKFRDEIRPRFGVMRGREFLMKDCYSFDLTQEDARRSYQKIFDSYLATFERMDLVGMPVRADTGAIGGDLSHEFHVLASTGESDIYYDSMLNELQRNKGAVTAEALMNIYAASGEMHDATNCPVPAERLSRTRGIEIGHIFYNGIKYTQAMKVQVANQKGEIVTPHTCCYGIGVSRLVAALIEAHHDEEGILWPPQVAPFHVGLINLRTDDESCVKLCQELLDGMTRANMEVLYDDRDVRAGVKFSDMDLIGLPWQVIVGPRGAATQMVEIKHRSSGERQELSMEQALNKLTMELKPYI